jgi:hypothetical protein
VFCVHKALIYHTNFTVCMYVARISRYTCIQSSVLSVGLRNGGRSWNVSPVDMGAHLYYAYISISNTIHFIVNQTYNFSEISSDLISWLLHFCFSSFWVWKVEGSHKAR